MRLNLTHCMKRCLRSCPLAVRLHVQLDHEGLLPALVAMTENKTHELSAARALRLPNGARPDISDYSGSIVVMDRGYNDDVWYNQLNNNDISFVTRLKTNARYRVIERHTVLKTKGLTCVQAIELTGARAKHCPIRLRRIGYKDAATGIHYTFLTNNCKLAASTIADSYKVKRFLGVSKNAVLTQIGIAMCVYLLLSCIRFLYKIQPSLQQWFQLLQLNLFERRDLLELLKGDPPEHRISPHQTTLLFS